MAESCATPMCSLQAAWIGQEGHCRPFSGYSSLQKRSWCPPEIRCFDAPALSTELTTTRLIRLLLSAPSLWCRVTICPVLQGVCWGQGRGWWGNSKPILHPPLFHNYLVSLLFLYFFSLPLFSFAEAVILLLSFNRFKLQPNHLTQTT